MGENFVLTKDIKKKLNLVHFKRFFLLEFTKQLIRNSESPEIIELQNLLEREKKLEENKKRIRETIKEREMERIKGEEGLSKNLSSSAKEIEGRETKKVYSIVHAPVGMFQTQENPQFNPFEKSFSNNPLNKPQKNNLSNPQNNPPRRVNLSIPESKFPAHIQYIQPVPINKEIELGDINALIKDYKVKVIECSGAGENIVVQGDMGTKKTSIILDKEGINKIIQRFSKETKIPAQEGVFKVVAGKLIFLAIISEIVGSKFIIKKMPNRQQSNYRL